MWISQLRLAGAVALTASLFLCLGAPSAYADRIDLLTFQGDGPAGDDEVFLREQRPIDGLPAAQVGEALAIVKIDDETVLAVVPTVLDNTESGRTSDVDFAVLSPGGYAGGGTIGGLIGGGGGASGLVGTTAAGSGIAGTAGGSGCCACPCFPWPILAVPAVIYGLFALERHFPDSDTPRTTITRIPPTPEPGTWMLMGTSLVALYGVRRRRSRA